MESCTSVDGFVIGGSNWGCLGDCNALTFQKNIVLEVLSPSDIRGSDILKNKKALQIFVGYLHDCNVYVGVTKDNTNTADLNYQTVRQAFIEAVDYGILQLKSGATYANLKSRCCDTFRKWVSKPDGLCRCRSHSTGLLKLYPRDIETFGRHFMCKFLQGLCQQEGQEDQPVNAFVFASLLGQNASYVSSVKLIQLFHLEKAEWCLLHLARDFRESNKCLLWLGDRLKHYYGNPKYQYFPGFTGAGAGNFKFVLNDSQKCTMQNNTDRIYAKEIKAYSTICKEVHRISPKPFASPVLPECLQPDKQRFQKTVANLAMLDGHINAVRGSIDSIRLANMVECRLEVIFLCIEPTATSIRLAKKVFDDHFGDDKASCLKSVNMGQWNKQADNTIVPVTKTLSQIINNWRAGLERNTNYVPTIRELVLATYCEALASFFAYGSFKNRSKGPWFVSFAVPLNLREAVFCKSEDNGGILFSSLNFTNVVKITGEVLKLTGDLQIQLLPFVDLWRPHFVAAETFKIVESLYSILIDQNFEGQSFDVIKQAFLKCLLTISSSVVGSCVRMTNRIERSDVDPGTAREFFAYLFNATEIIPDVVLLQLVSSLKEVVSVENYSVCQAEMSNFLELEIYKTNDMAIMYPMHQPSLYVVVLPISPQINKRYTGLTESEKAQLHRRFVQIIEKLFEITVRDLDVARTLANIEIANLFVRQNLSMHRVLMKIIEERHWGAVA